jgi:hypothetical protein
MVNGNIPLEITFDGSVISRVATVVIQLRGGSPDVNLPYASDDLETNKGDVNQSFNGR